MEHRLTIRTSSKDIEKLKQLTGATTMNGAVDIAIQYALDSYRKDIDFDLLNFVEKIVQERMHHYTKDIMDRIDRIQKEFEQLYIAEGEVAEAIQELVLLQRKNKKMW
ncbi:hypothetical protein [Erysipelothrix rhusiopathiae]|uniref:hypothetical protein n=1 Tax=Erysipelothrix rhusiopathiae TaxID=1648 RepID=UPI00247FD43F|nr:hypothetical protein [Erysipelothrix rhusiopathiae]